MIGRENLRRCGSCQAGFPGRRRPEYDWHGCWGRREGSAVSQRSSFGCQDMAVPYVIVSEKKAPVRPSASPTVQATPLR